MFGSVDLIGDPLSRDLVGFLILLVVIDALPNFRIFSGKVLWYLKPEFRSLRDKSMSRTANEPTLTRPLGTLSHEAHGEREQEIRSYSPLALWERGWGVRVWS